MATEQKHTPGPWVARPRKHTNGAEWEVIAGDYFVCAFGFSPNDDGNDPEAEANARLIAAAPDLLAKCEKIVAWLDRLAAKAEREAKDCRFITLKEAYEADAKNYRATAADVRTAIAQATICIVHPTA